MEIKLIEMMGGDYSAIECARISYGSEADSGLKDVALIDFLIKKDHLSPFESIVFRFYAKVPIFTARQIMRHRIGGFNERSGRYTELNEIYLPNHVSEDVYKIMSDMGVLVRKAYHDMLDIGVKLLLKEDRMKNSLNSFIKNANITFDECVSGNNVEIENK